MVKVRIFLDGESYFGIEIEGHANINEKGKDLVCAGISSAVFGCLNALEKPKSFDIQIDKDGYFSIKRLESPLNEHDKIVLDTLISILETLRESNKKAIKIERL